MKKVASILLLLCMVIGLVGGYGYIIKADQSTTQSEGHVTRLEWLKALTDTFEMEVDERNYPDNYFSDVDESSEDYYDIMLATEFGLVDVEAGEALRPNDVATREFAVHTLNVCMGYLPDENVTYTFCEAEDVIYKDDIQIAIDKGWLTLYGEHFLPEQGITQEEKEKMITEAEKVVASVKIDSSYENSFKLVDGVVSIPEDTVVVLTDENELTFTNLGVGIEQGDIFVVYSCGFPVPRRAVSVTTMGNETIVVVEEVEMEEAFTEMEAQGTMSADLTQVQPVDDSVTLSYIVGGTPEKLYDDGRVYHSLEKVGNQEVTAVIATKTFQKINKNGRTLSGNVSITDYASVKCKITNVSADYDVSILNQKAYLNVHGSVTFSFNMETGDIPLLGFDEPFVKVPIGVIGYFKPSVEGSVSGDIALVMKGRVSAGIQWTAQNGVRLNYDFKKEAFTIQAKVEARLGVKATAGVDVGFLKAEIYAKAGAKASVKITTHTDNIFPQECKHVAAHLYASVGANAKFNIIVYKASVTLNKDFITEANSPVKVVLHYEDGKAVPTCTRDVGDENTGNGENSASKKYKYYTPIDSQYAFSGANKGISSTGEEYAIFEYSLDEDNQATITKYNGNVSALQIPETIDGYTVVGIGNRVFQNNTRLLVVHIPDTVTTIGNSAFSDCSNLMDVTLSKSLVSLGGYAFRNCDSLTMIEIPKSLDNVAISYKLYGAFADCDNLKDVAFEEGTTKVCTYLFNECTGLEQIRIPDTVIEIEQYAFSGCSSLKDVRLSNSLVTLGYYAFYDCDSLTSIEIPKSLESTSYYGTNEGAFNNCDNLKLITFEEGTTEIAEYLFSGCTGLEEIIIPNTVTVIEKNAFYGCTNLKEVVISSHATEIQAKAFYGCKALTKVVVPDTVTSIGNSAFADCSGLKDVRLSESLVTMGYYAFYDCDSLTSIEIPKSLESTSYYGASEGVFNNCDNLKTVTFEEGTTEIAEYLFSRCTGLEEIVIPNTVIVIEKNAFYGCTNLKEVVISSHATEIQAKAFYGCKALTKVVVPDTVTSIGNSAFADCSGLKDVRLSKSLVTMGYYAFYDCDSLTSIEIPKSLESTSHYGASEGAFNNCDNLKTVTFEEGTTEIAEYLFSGCTGLEEIIIPNTVKIIEKNAFRNCSNLKTIKMYEGIETIESGAFCACSSLISIIIPDTVSLMGKNVFSECIRLESVKLPNIQEIIGEGMFQDCTSLEEIKLPDSITTIAQHAFINSGLKKITLPNQVKSIGNYTFYNCSNLSEVTLSVKLTTIGSYAFYNCDGLIAMSIPDSVTSIGTYCFADCENLTDVYLGSGITKINSYTFNLCPSLKKIVLPYRMTSVAANAFTNCTQLVELTIPRATTSIANNAFSYPTNMTVYGISGTYAEEWANSVGATFVHQEKLATTVALNHTSLILNNGKTANLVVSVTPSDFTDEITWKSSNTSVATISDNGVVTAKGVGTATIRVTVGNVSASCKVTVVQPVTSMSINKTTLSLDADQTYKLIASVYPNSATDKTVTWSSSDDSIASVNQTGLVTAKKKGTAIITVTANDGSGISKTCTVTVLNSNIYCTDISELESDHNYKNNSNDTWIYTCIGANEIKVTFDERTEVEEDFDFIYLYDASNTEIGVYTGTVLAGKTIIIEGDTVKIKLVADNVGNEWGFKVTSVKGDGACTIVTHPESKKVQEGEIAVFTVVAEGNSLTYQWQYSKDNGLTWKDSSMTGAKTASLKVEGTASRNGQMYRCTVISANGSQVITNAVQLMVTEAKEELTIITNPSNQSITVGEKAEFTVITRGEGLTYQWQYSKDNGIIWKNSGMQGSKTATIFVEGRADRNGQLYRCVVIDSEGNQVITSAVKLTVTEAKEELAIVTNPVSQSIKVGEKAKFTVVAQGDGLTYQWQYSKSNGVAWANSSSEGAKTATLVIDGKLSTDGRLYRCIITDSEGNKLITSAVKLTVTEAKEELAIVTNPVSQRVEVGEKAKFTVVAKGEGLTYQWQYSKSNGVSWANSSSEGSKTATLVIEGKFSSDGRLYRCIITDSEGNKVISSAAKLTVTEEKEELEIIINPESHGVKVGEKAEFTVAARGEGLTYQWQYSKSNGVAWANSSSEGSKTATLVIEGKLSSDGRLYRCIITDSEGNKVISSAAKLTVTEAKEELAIITNPTDQSVEAGEKAEFTVAAKGEGLSYQWQYSKSNGAVWANSSSEGSKTATLVIEGKLTRDGQLYRCVIMDSEGNQLTSSPAKLQVRE